MVSEQAKLAAAAVLGFRFGGPIARKVISAIPGVPAEFTDDFAGALGAGLAFWLAKRFLR